MTKTEYLKRCVLALTPLEYPSWYVYMLGIALPAKHNWEELDLLSPYPQEDGMYFVDLEGEEQKKVLTKITDTKPGQAVFNIKEMIDVDHSWLPTISGNFQTKLGNLLLNAVALYPSVKAKLPYENGAIKVKDLEAKIAKLLESDDKATEHHISTSEQEACFDRLWFFTTISKLINIAATPKLVTRAPGTKELRKKLLAEHKDQLSDPAVVASIVAKLDEHDKEYLKDDPVVAMGLSKKENTARKKLHQMYGETNDFDAKLGSDPILGSMDEGLNTDPRDLSKYINDLRYASYSRGHSTQLAGYTYKILQRSLSGMDIVDTDCNTLKGYARLITKRNVNKLVGRYVKPKPTDKQWTLVESEDQAGSYMGQNLTMRSAMYCQSPNNTLCYRCLGETFKGSTSAMTNLAASMSAEFMTLFLKRMHTSGFTLTTIEKKDLIT